MTLYFELTNPTFICLDLKHYLKLCHEWPMKKCYLPLRYLFNCFEFCKGKPNSITSLECFIPCLFKLTPTRKQNLEIKLSVTRLCEISV